MEHTDPALEPGPRTRTRHPWVWALLHLPFGLTIGFPSIAIGYVAARAGVPVGSIAGIIGMTWLASGWKFTWAPLGDYTLTRKRWYLIAISLVSVGFLAISSLPITRAGAAQALFGSIAPEWSAGTDTVAAVLGLGGGLAIVAGCFVGGLLATEAGVGVAALIVFLVLARIVRGSELPGASG